MDGLKYFSGRFT